MSRDSNWRGRDRLNKAEGKRLSEVEVVKRKRRKKEGSV
jgi:hypothetical protein